jgi:hypothetical protein
MVFLQKKASASPAIHTDFSPEPADFRFLQKNGAPVLLGMANLIHREKATRDFL